MSTITAQPLVLARTHYIFVTGGVMSSLGKGLTASSLAAVLQARGFSVVMQKLDPYLNVDPGTMSPFQHGEVYVTDDGAETDLDLGHYERYTGVPTGKFSNITSGQIYWNILHRERRGDYLGKTVQMIPHVTNEIKGFIKQTDGMADFALIEIGGTVGDIESMTFIEAIRQFAREQMMESRHNRCCFMHLTFAPYLRAVGEIKTKPTQNAVRDLLHAGIQADVVVVRSEREVPRAELDKIALFANLPATHVVNCPDSDTIYRVPVTLHRHGLDEAILSHFGLTAPQPDLMDWQRISAIATVPLAAPEDENRKPAKGAPSTVTIAVVGKYVQVGDSYKSLNEALLHGGFAHNARVVVDFVDSEILEGMTPKEIAKRLQGAAGILVPGGFGSRGTEGKMLAVQYAREHGVPYFGICLGLQMAVTEFARNAAGLKGADSTEFTAEKGNPLHPVICQMTEWQTPSGQKMLRDAQTDLGGTMRLGAYPCKIKPQTLAAKIYSPQTLKSSDPVTLISERHRHRFEFNPRYRKQLEEAGLVFSGTSPTDPDLVEIVELPAKVHPFFIGVQYHPEFKSQPLNPHPLFASFIAAALAHKH